MPTLEKGVYRNVSPMLKIRYGAFGKWINATHGDWLDTKEMESPWNEDEKDERLIGIVRDIKLQRIIGKTMLLDYLRQTEFPFLQQAIMAMK